MPIVKNVAQHFDQKVEFLKINASKCPQVAQKLKINSVPTFILIKKGKELERTIGLKSFNDLKQLIENKFNLN